jgi:hypothetical protein
LTSLLSDSDWSVRVAASEAIGQMGKEGAAALPQLTPLLSGSDSYVRVVAARAIGQMGKEGAAALPQLTSLLSDSVWDVRAAAAQAIGQMGESGMEAMPQLMKATSDPEPNVRVAAIEAIGQISADISISQAPESLSLAEVQYQLIQESLILGMLVLLFLVGSWAMIAQRNAISLSLTGQLILFLPEECTAELGALEHRLKAEKENSLWRIRLFLLWCFLELLWSFYVQINLENLTLPNFSQRREKD